MTVQIKRYKRAGSSPGTLVHIGEQRTAQVRVHVIDYQESGIEEREVTSVEQCVPFKNKPSNTWINVTGIHQIDIIEQIGRGFELHPLLLEDVVNTTQRPKLEDYEGHLFILVKMLTYDENAGEVRAEQISFVLGDNFVISFQETEGDMFDPVRDRIRSGKGRIRKMKSDYLAYALLDAIVDHYFIILEKLGERIEVIDDQILTNPQTETISDIHNLKREMLLLRKSVWPLREVVVGLERSESKLVRKPTKIFLRDVYDHTIQVIDTTENHREMLSGMLDLYMSTVSNRMNSVMKVLTIIATIFIPLTFIAGIYGMNFKYMPELDWPWGYPLALAIMLGIGGVMLYFFKRNKWL